jgi:hypothetical protein
MKTSPFAEEIVSAIYAIYSIVSQIIGVVAYMKWVHPLESVMSYTGPDQMERFFFFALNGTAYMCLALYMLRPLAVLAAGLVREVDSLFRREDRV